jgi:cytochrome bd-type quinol oxidase subunit 2
MKTVCKIFLWLVLLPFMEAAYRPGHLVVYLLCCLVQACLVVAAARVLSRSGQKGLFEPTSFLLVGSWLFASLALNMHAPPQGRDWLDSVGDQYIRYAALVLAALFTLAGLATLTARLREGRQRSLAVIGCACAVISTLLFIACFLPYPALLSRRFELEAISGASPPWWPSFAALVSSVSIVQPIAAHAGTVLFVAALWKLGQVGKWSALTIAVLAVLLSIAGALIHLPPALAFAPSYLIGVALLGIVRPQPSDTPVATGGA